jgi:predicted dehydrogenase
VNAAVGSSPIGLAIIGVGNWARRLAASLRRVPDSVLVACHARSAEPRERFAVEHGCRAAPTLDDLFADDVDGVLIATPHRSHPELVEAAAAHGVAAMVEKPLALTTAAARRCVTAADRAGTILQVAHYRRRLGATRALHRLVETGALGRLHLVEGHFTRRLGPDKERPWRDDPAEAPVGAMTALGVHMADNLLYLAGPAVRLSAYSTRLGRESALDDMSGALIEFESGALGTLTTSLRIPRVITCAAHGTDMVAWSEEDGTRLFTLGADDARMEQPIEAGDPVVDNLAHFVACIRTGLTPETGGPEGLAVVEILEAMAISAAAGGAPVDLASLR